MNQPKPLPKKIFAARDNQIQELDDDEVDVELVTPSNLFSTHINLIPMQSAVQGPRLFYGARFYNQALPLVHPEAPLVQNIDDSDPSGASFDEKLGRSVGSVFADEDGEIVDLTPDNISIKLADGTVKNKDIYNNFIFNRKSVTGDSQLLIRRDNNINSVAIAEYNYSQGDEVLSYCPETKKSKWQEITGYLKHINNKKLYTVMYESGRSVTVTEDHSLLTLNSDWNISPVYPLDCIINETRSPSVFAEVTRAGTQEDFEEGALVGLYLSEGSITKQQHGTIQIAVEPSARIAEVRELVRKVRNVNPQNGKVNCSFTDHSLYDFLAENCGCGAGNKYISNLLLNKPRRYLEGIIAGYMGGDGCLWQDGNGAIQVVGVTTSKRLRDDLTVVLNLLGIFTTRFDCPRTHLNAAWNNAYGFRAISAHLYKLDKWFFYSDRECKFRKALKTKFRASVFEQIPVPGDSGKKLYKSLPGKTPNTVYQSVFHGYISKHRLIAAKGIFGQWGNSDILWDKIIDIVPAEHEEFVYDLEVENSHAFAVNNGLLVHNTGYNNIPVIKKGDVVKKGQLLAHSNYSDSKGTLALGANARVGLVPYKGFSMDDAIVISDSFAKRLTSDHAYTHEQDFDRDTKGGLNHYVSLFPTAFTKAQIKKMDSTGVIKPGSVVNEGDPLILATRPRAFSSTTSQLGKLSKSMRQSRHDSSQKWDSPFPGTVTDVAKTKTGYKVIVKSEAPAQSGDKIVFRTGQKSFHPDTEVFTTRGWVKIPNLLQTDLVASLFDRRENRMVDGKGIRKNAEQDFIAKFVKPHDAHSYIYDGELYGLDTQWVSYLTTPNHRIWRKGNSNACVEWSCMDAQKVHGGTHKFMMRANFELPTTVDPEFFTLPKVYHGRSGEEMDCATQFPWKSWVQFMALYLSEGNIRHTHPGDHCVVITQKEKPFCRVIERVLDELGFSWTYYNMQYTTSPNKAVRLYLEQFGKAVDKFIPENILNASKETLQLFKDTIWQCDGDKDRGKEYYSCSPRLIDGVERILIQLGHAATISTRPAREHQNYTSHTISILSYTSVGTKKNYKKAYFKQKYTGPVYCIQVPGLGVILTRFRGKVMWNGNSIISKILPDEHMPRTKDGKPLEVLLNQLGMPSRVNSSLLYELLLGKAAAARGEPIKVPGFNKKGEKWYDFVSQALKDNNLSETEEVFDPMSNRMLENPITVGIGHILKLHHTSNSKVSARGQGSYDSSQQPLKGGSESAQSKRLSGLEIGSLLSSGAYKTIKEGATLRGQQNDNYWRALRQGYKPQAPGAPFVWEKFKALLTGAGLQARKLPKGELRLGPFTDDDLDKQDALEVKSGELIDLNSMEPIPGGLFDQTLVGSNRWGKISLPFKVPNPAFEPVVRNLLGLTEKELRGILAGQIPLPEHLR